MELRNYLNTDCFLISGPSVWQVAYLGQTSQSVGCRWVYNDEKEGVVKLNGTYYKLFKRKFPEVITIEWWIVDLLNNNLSASISFEQARPHLNQMLKNKEVDVESLLELTKVYGSEKVKYFVESCCVEAGCFVE